MKKNSGIIWFITILGAVILTVFLFGDVPWFHLTPLGMHEYLPSYNLFEMPNEPEGGDILYTFFVVSTCLIFYCLINLIINSVNKNQGFNFIKEIKKSKKENYSSPIMVVLIVCIGLPLFYILCDYINLSIGMPDESGQMLHVAQGSIFVIAIIIWLIYFFYNIIKKK